MQSPNTHPSIRLQPVLMEVLRARAEGGVMMPPKSGVHFGPGHFFHAMVAASQVHGLAICKWIGLAPADGKLAGQQTHSTMLLSDVATGRLLRVMDADRLTLMRTVALSVAAYAISGRGTPASLGFIAGGRQAQEHLSAFLQQYPGVPEAHLYEPRPRGEARFREICASHDVALHIHAQPEGVLEAAQLIVSSVPGTSPVQGFLDLTRTRDDAFVCAVDVARSWSFERAAEAQAYQVTDDLPQTRALIEQKNFPMPLDFDTDLPALAAGQARYPDRGRVMFTFAGNAYADLAGAIWMHQSGAAVEEL